MFPKRTSEEQTGNQPLCGLEECAQAQRAEAAAPPFPGPHPRAAGPSPGPNCVMACHGLTRPARTPGRRAEGGMFLPACHIKVPVEHLLSKFLSLHSPWKLQMCEFISQQVRLHECLIAKRKKKQTTHRFRRKK